MKRILKRSLALALMSGVAAWAGALVLDLADPEANPEAKSMKAALVARVSACHEPAKSVVTASVVRSEGGELRRTPLQVVPLQTPGTFAILGALPPGSVVDLAVTNPEYRNYQPRVFIRSDAHGPQWAGIRRFFGTPPTDSDVKRMLGEVD